MSSVTLETLKADYEAAVEAFRVARLQTSNRLPVAEEIIRRFNAYTAERHAYTMYAFARDFGVSAAMLWKLSDGNIDPRNP